MNINEKCLPCLVNQAVNAVNVHPVENKQELYRKIFAEMSRIDMSKTNPEIIGTMFGIIKQHIGCSDPYKEIKDHYNGYFHDRLPEYREKIKTFFDAVKYAAAANVIDFTPVGSNVGEDTKNYFSDIDSLCYSIDETKDLLRDIRSAKSILYIGDNCGEICFDRILIEKIKEQNPSCKIYFGVRGTAVVNDNTEADAEKVGMNKVAEIVSNGDTSLGTVIPRTSENFRRIFESADVVISKGQANYESLSEENKNIYFLLLVKCRVIAEYIGAPAKTLVCMKNGKAVCR